MSPTPRLLQRGVVAAAGAGLVLASFAGAAGPASASATHRPRTAAALGHVLRSPAARPAVSPAGDGTGVRAAAGPAAEIPVATLAGGGAGALPEITVTDPGVIASGDTLTLALDSAAGGVTLDPARTPVLTATTGASASAASMTPTTVSFVLTKSATGLAASYVITGLGLVGTSATTSGAVAVAVTATHQNSAVPPVTVVDAGAAPVVVAAVTHLLPAAYGPAAPDTAAVLFGALAATNARFQSTPTSAVLASDYAPQDAESANYLAGVLSEYQNPKTGILLTDPAELSPAAASALAAYPSITTVYIVGGESVVSAAVATRLAATYRVVRIAGPTQYDTNAAVLNYAAANLGAANSSFAVDYTRTGYNTTSGASSPTTTNLGSVKTAIVASGDGRSYQDGIVSGPLAWNNLLPVILTTPTALSSTAQALLGAGGYRQVILLGGPLAVSDAVEAELTAPVGDGGSGVSVFRIAGSDASDTSTRMADFLIDNGGQTQSGTVDQGSADGGVLIARGTGFQDALAAGPYAGFAGRTPILLTENATTLGAPLAAYLEAAGRSCVYAAQAIGGPMSVTAGVQQAAIDAEFAGLSSCVVPPARAPDAPVITAGVSENDGRGSQSTFWAALTFDAPASDGGSVVTGYQISTDGGSTWTDLPVSGASPYTVRADQSTQCVIYAYLIRAVNRLGPGAASNEQDVDSFCH